ncbi:hypothetical protein LSTR_LSTR004236 [Laodelphax striatellus]|uniref:Uncharacterized protein n=1 Tax=Laodelphax striatellus TaxID=195883 RepID=A0A482XDC0_LAOST|nr:hypothetical protein LSTR_LSTR004236 [Laodelphax striatellus]
MRIEYIFCSSGGPGRSRLIAPIYSNAQRPFWTPGRPDSVSHSEDSPSDFFCRQDLFPTANRVPSNSMHFGPGHQAADLVALG